VGKQMRLDPVVQSASDVHVSPSIAEPDELDDVC
jgi:hypothetical protein